MPAHPVLRPVLLATTALALAEAFVMEKVAGTLV